MYIYVRFTEKEQYYKSGPDGLVKARLEQASGERCLVVPYQEMSMRVVRELSPRAIAMSGFGGHFHTRNREWFFGASDVLHEADLPMICFCGSHQLMGLCFQRDIRKGPALRILPMRRLRAGEHWPRRPCTDPAYDLSPYFVAEGFFPIRRVASDPLFAGLPRTMILHCSHYCELKALPKGFDLLASSDHCRIEAMRHRSRPIWGTQFHPEAYDAPFFHGRRILENFARIVERFWKARQK